MANYTTATPNSIIAKAMFNFDAFGMTNFKYSGTISISTSNSFSYSDYLYNYSTISSNVYTSSVSQKAWTSSQLSYVNQITASFTKIANINFTPVTDYSKYNYKPSDVGNSSNINISFIYRDDLYFSGSSALNTTSFFKYASSEGDIVLNTYGFDIYGANNDTSLNPYSYGWHTLMHEIGHNLGLSHPHLTATATGYQLTTDFIATQKAGFSALGFHINSASDMNKEYFTIMSYDDGYRSRDVPFSYGKLTQEKIIIGKEMKRYCINRGISENIEISEESRIYGPQWLEFISNCRAVLGTESGSNVFDFEGIIKPEIDKFQSDNPEINFETVHKKFLENYDDKILMNQISPRIFEAIAMRTALVLFEGNYSGVLYPWKHYIPLKKDFSNIEEIFNVLDDISKLEKIVNDTYDDIIISNNYHYKKFIKMIDDHITKFCKSNKGYIPCMGIIGWRNSFNEPMRNNNFLNFCTPTTVPLRHFDFVNIPILSFKFNANKLQRVILDKYRLLLFSIWGQKLKILLQKSPLFFRISRALIHILTGRLVK